MMSSPILCDRRTGKRIRANRPHHIDGDLFSGTLLFQTEQLPDGRSAHIVVVGHFHRSVRCAHCLTGQAFDRPLRLPPLWGMASSIGIALLRSWAGPTLSIDTGHQPHMLTQLMAVASRVEAAAAAADELTCARDRSPSTILATSEKQIRSTRRCHAAPEEDDLLAMTTALPEEMQRRVCGGHRARRAFFKRSAAAASTPQPSFEPGVEFSFHFYVQRIDLASSRLVGLPPPLHRAHIDTYLGDQPLRLLCVHHDQPPSTPAWSMAEATSLWDVEVWSERQWANRHAAELASSGARIRERDPRRADASV